MGFLHNLHNHFCRFVILSEMRSRRDADFSRSQESLHAFESSSGVQLSFLFSGRIPRSAGEKFQRKGIVSTAWPHSQANEATPLTMTMLPMG
jgi:hypothetical protein